MTPEEIEEIIRLTNANKPQVNQTLNFNAPIGQQIAHVDKIEAHFDKDMSMQVACCEEPILATAPADGAAETPASPTDEASPLNAEKSVEAPSKTTENGTDTGSEGSVVTQVSDSLLRRLTPIFKGDVEAARMFAVAVANASDSVIPKVVNQCVEENKIAGWAKNKELWTALHDEGLYTLSYQNWSKQIK